MISNRCKKITNRGKEISNRGKDYKSCRTAITVKNLLWIKHLPEPVTFFLFFYLFSQPKPMDSSHSL